ncbi:RhuM family protein [uncultured Fibrobacter sp.]|uniref:RhuM family protein n=1 Tax=uncultured Fibrobacter sp. TaxID=261512 RepID=UPI00260105A1|nr:RhuM family protein [uncultured Fibrobacter sp.]
MAENEKKGEIVIYQPEGEIRLEVRVENETVWLTQAQIAELFLKDQSVIARHIKNVFKEGELTQESNMQILHNTLSKFKPTTIYSLDVIISVGYRVKSLRGTQFRRWANQVLKDFMLKGYAINQRKIATDLQIADRLHEHQQLINRQNAEIADFKDKTEKRLSTVEQHIDFFVKAVQTPTGGILATGTQFDGLVLITDLVKSAKLSVVFIDPFATTDVLKFATARAKGVTAIIYTPRITPEFKEAARLHNIQYPGLELKTMRTIHDRFLLIDDTVYHFGASFKDMGNEMTVFSVLDFITPQEVIKKVEDCTKGKK